MKAVVAAFNQEKALVGAFSVITNLRMELFQALLQARLSLSSCSYTFACYCILLFYRPAVWSGVDQGTGGQWVRPAAELTARGWAYNVFNITNTQEATYRCQQH